MTIRRRHALVRRGVLLLPLVSLLVLPPRASMGAQPPAGAAQAPPPLPVTPKVPTSHAGLFAERDARAVAAIGYLRCFQGAVTALRTGALGQVPTGWSIACLQQGREWRAVFGELTEEAPGFAVRRQLALRGDGAVVTDPVDTARAGGVARALLRGLSAPVPGRGVAEFVPLVLHQGTYTEVWFLSPPADPARVAVEAYPALLAHELIGPRSYKNAEDDTRLIARKDLLGGLELGRTRLGLRVAMTAALRDRIVDDAGGDRLDALLCLVQAAWAAQRPDGGLPAGVDPVEGWIVTAGFPERGG